MVSRETVSAALRIRRLNHVPTCDRFRVKLLKPCESGSKFSSS